MIRAVRGATTVEKNDAGEILSETRELLKEIVEANGIKPEDMVSILFSVTKDLDAAFPALAARQLGWTHVAMMCANEIDVPGSLEKCIRVMMHFITEKSNPDIRHIYRKGAAVLRPDWRGPERKAGEGLSGRENPREIINIAIDGPAGAGKSTVAKLLAKSLGIAYLDTGAMYRAVALKAMEQGIDTRDEALLAGLVKDIDLKVTYEDGKQRVFLDGRDVSSEIRSPEISMGASNVATVPAVRLKLTEIQREIALQNSVVLDGRDIGTFVLPNADLKIFLTASPEERARRRHKELLEKGIGVSFEEVKRDMENRDANDTGRKFRPLFKADDAVEIDNTNLTPEQTAEKIITMVKKLGLK